MMLFTGLLLGFSIAAPVGPIGVLCIRRTLAHGQATGFISGLGAATADAFYGSVAALGLTFLSGLLVGQQFWLRLAGGLFLCYLGVRTFLARPAPRPAGPVTGPAAPHERSSYASAYASTLFLTLTNPMTIISFTAIFAGLDLDGARASASAPATAALTLVLGVFLGSALWWLLLSLITNVLRLRFLTPRGLGWVNRLSGLVITAFGLAALASLLLPR